MINLGLEGETTEWLRRPFQPTTSEVDVLLTFAYRPNFRPVALNDVPNNKSGNPLLVWLSQLYGKVKKIDL